MSKVQDDLRAMVRKLRTTSVPIQDLIPLLTEAADEIDRLAEFEYMYESVSK